MNSHGTESHRPEGRNSQLLFRFFWGSAALGLFIGLLEAKLLWTSPRVLPLLYPDVRYVIWFLAPLVDMIFFGLVGLILGWLAGRARNCEALIALETGIAAIFVILMLRWFHLEIGLHAFSFQEEVFIPLAWFGLIFIVSLLILALFWERLGGYLERRINISRKPLVFGLLGAAIVAVAGVGVFTVQVSNPHGSVQAAPRPAAQSPNIIFITLDTLRADHLSSYGYSRPTTPHLDRFARQGVLFENAIAPASWTLASHASMFTGLLPHQHGADWSIPLTLSPWTLAEILRSRGYETAGFTSNFRYCERGWGIAQGFETYIDNSACLRHNLAQTLVGNAIAQPLYQNLCRYDSFNRRSARQLNGSVFDWFRRRSKRPYFLFINYFDVHEPYVMPVPYDHRFGKSSSDLIRRLNFDLLSEGPPPRFSIKERAALIADYDNCLAYLDEQVGRLLQFLQSSPDWQNTIVIITADHGEAFGEHDRYSHGYNLYRELLHVPLIIEGPGVPKDLRIKHLAPTRELFSTVLDFAWGGKTLFSRYSLARFWSPEFTPRPFDDVAISELVPIFEEDKGISMMSLTTPEWQYIYNSNGRQELYHWPADSEEQTDLAGSSAGQETMQNLHGQLVDLIRNSSRPWRGAEYLLPLGQQGLFLHDVLFMGPPQPGVAGSRRRVGTTQSYFKSGESETPIRPSSSEQDLMRSLPYH